jgi:hypothetical protein
MRKILLLVMLTSVLLASNWKKVVLDEDPFTGKKIVTFLNTSKTKGKLGKDITLIVRCGNNKYPEIFVEWNTFLHNKKVKMIERIVTHNKKHEDVKTKIQAEYQSKYQKLGYSLVEAKGKYYTVSKDFTSLFYPENDTLKSNYELTLKTALYKLANEKALILRVAPYNDNPITAKFNLSGLQKIISPYKEVCHLPNEKEVLEMSKVMLSNLKKELELFN